MQVQINQPQNGHALADAPPGAGHPIADRRQSTGRPKVTIRMALNEDGPVVGALVEQLLDGVDLGDVDWSKVNPNWLVAVWEDRIVGCIQVVLGHPFGCLEFMAVEPGLPSRVKTMAVKGLVYTGASTLVYAGCQFAAGMVPFEMKSYLKVLKKRGAVPAFKGQTFLKRLQ